VNLQDHCHDGGLFENMPNKAGCEKPGYKKTPGLNRVLCVYIE
jgi:hypothetical protein